MSTNLQFWSHLAQFFLQLEIYQTKAVDNIKTHLLCSLIFFSPQILPFMLKNMVETGGPQMTIYKYAPHNELSVKDGPHIRWWSHKIIIFWGTRLCSG
jgi:hypothetical protein